MILGIETQDSKQIKVYLKEDNKQIDELIDHNQFGSQVLLGLIEKILDKNNLKSSDLKEIEVSKGPGSFTGLRVGIAVANALAYSLNIPVNNKKLEVDLIYE